MNSTREKRINRLINFVILVILLGASCLLSWHSLTKGQEWGDDFAEYLMQAKSIIAKNPIGFIEKNRFTIETSTHTIGPVAYPWGYPMLLAPSIIFLGLICWFLKS